jgi:hypothetical protein
VNIHLHFHFPIVYWLYASDPDPEYYTSYYGSGYYVNPFRYARCYYPTETLRDLGEEASGLGYQEQQNFRTGLETITEQLRMQISEKLAQSYNLTDNDIVITHYQNLQNAAYVVEGFVNQGNLSLAFKGIIDLYDPTFSAVYVAFGDDPTEQDRDLLNWINDRIIQLGGDPFTAHLEPEFMPIP